MFSLCPSVVIGTGGCHNNFQFPQVTTKLASGQLSSFRNVLPQSYISLLLIKIAATCHIGPHRCQLWNHKLPCSSHELGFGMAGGSLVWWFTTWGIINDYLYHIPRDHLQDRFGLSTTEINLKIINLKLHSYLLEINVDQCVNLCYKREEELKH